MPPHENFSERLPLHTMVGQVWHMLSASERGQAMHVCLLLTASSALDVLGLAGIVQLAIGGANTEQLDHLRGLRQLKQLLHIQNTQTLVALTIVLVGLLFLLKQAVGLQSLKRQSAFAFQVAKRLSRKQLAIYLEQSVVWHSSQQSAKLTRNFLAVPTEFAQQILLSLLLMFGEGSIALVIVGFLLVFQPLVVLLLALLMLPLLGLLLRRAKKRAGQLGSERAHLHPQGQRLGQEVLQHVPEVQLHGRENVFLDIMDRHNTHLMDVVARLYVVNQLPPRMVELAVVAGVLSLFSYAAFVASSPGLVLVMLSTFAAAAYRLTPSANRILSSLVKLRDYRFAHVLMRESHLTTLIPLAPVQEGKLEWNCLHVHNISYTYPGQQHAVLQCIDFSIFKGQHIGISGASGSGKSTLLYLLMGLIQPDGGQLELDGKALTETALPAWRNQIAFVRQEVTLLDDSLAANVAFGVEHVDEQRVQIALEGAALWQWTVAQANGMHTFVGEGGARLSGGQRQRLAIARALYRNAHLWVFDEATSHLDAEAELQVLASIARLTKLGHAVISVSHRQSVLASCDRMYSLVSGTLHELPYSVA